MVESPTSAYTVIKNTQPNHIGIYYNDKKIHDEERVYMFNPDGSASVQSCAWGFKSKCPVGTFSDLLLKLPNTKELNSEIAKKLARAYDKYARENADKLEIIV
ncbi:MAG: hypothetical protein MJ180_00450 [Candidatus Gastranaerophilales bacterium]|nr:hypothetical protein [Candidatus Gastranaerophilales bacterium]